MSISQAATLAEVIRLQAQLRGESTALVFEGRSTSFATLDQHASQVANGLIALGVKPCQRVAYLGKNSDIFIELLLGAIKVNVVMAPVNWRLAAPEIAFIVRDCQAQILFVGPEFVEQVRDLAAQLADVRVVMTTEGGASEWQDFRSWRDAQSDVDPMTPLTKDDIAIQLYTSGTTGKPKGAMLTHHNFLSLLRIAEHDTPDWNRWTADDVSLVAMPVFHIGGIGWAVYGLYHGAKSVIAREFDPNKVLDDFAQYGISKLFLVPAAMQFIVRQPRARDMDFSKLRYILYGASPIPAALLKECISVFKCGFVQMYGMTETTGTIVVLAPEDHVEGRACMRSAGKALAGVEIAILDANGASLPTGEVGEIATRSGSNMAGYWNLPEATARTLDADNWLRTGDAGYLDEDGYLYIHDRIKDMIISGGENIYPAEVESAICDHPDVAEVAVVGVPDDTWGEAVKAVVVLKPGKELSATDLMRFTRERIAGFKSPKTIDFISALPRNASGKILRRHLRDPYWEGRERQVN
ncbi:fatty acid--CoA ligase [Tardiphaga sp.]|uniref:fatty acid--CoA ligase n=1 Tax=Tardiphaga sp. TaxID=1926292 RepID=UPI0026383F62|nr:fatty acid--CoA ligase [Tardiphaga sp.]MDB5619012.1 AMP-dependent synthetase and ligase [Tardiphaga sp.]